MKYCSEGNLNYLPATDIWVMSIAPTQIHLAVSGPKATGSDCSGTIQAEGYNIYFFRYVWQFMWKDIYMTYYI